MKYRDLHPGDIILVWGDTKVVERVDRTHIATRGPNDHLELWSYDGDHLDSIKFENRLHLKDLGFTEDHSILVFDTYDGYVVRWTKEACFIINERDKYPAKTMKSKYCATLNQVQQFFYEVTGIELKLDI
jgi:hypothetical protein